MPGAKAGPYLQPIVRNQRGQALLILLLLLGVFASTLIYTFVSRARFSIAESNTTSIALSEARDALIGRAAADSNRPGSLPCPDTDNDGSANGPFPSACSSYVGRLPWRTLGLPDLRDGSGERLWYALSTYFRDWPAAGALNSDRAGELTVTGIHAATNVIAIIFAPGPALENQSRAALDENNVANYLEGENANGDTTYITALSSNTFNDKALLITRETLFPTVEKRVAREVRYSLRNYRTENGRFPPANPYSIGAPYNCVTGTSQGRIPLSTNFLSCLGFPNPGPYFPTWFAANNWNHVVFYAVTSDCANSGLFQQLFCALGLGTILNVLGLNFSPDPGVLIFTAGWGLPGLGQTRPCASDNNCLDDAENVNGNNTFVKPVRSATNNDQIFVVFP